MRLSISSKEIFPSASLGGAFVWVLPIVPSRAFLLPPIFLRTNWLLWPRLHPLWSLARQIGQPLNKVRRAAKLGWNAPMPVACSVSLSAWRNRRRRLTLHDSDEVPGGSLGWRRSGPGHQSCEVDIRESRKRHSSKKRSGRSDRIRRQPESRGIRRLEFAVSTGASFGAGIRFRGQAFQQGIHAEAERIASMIFGRPFSRGSRAAPW